MTWAVLILACTVFWHHSRLNKLERLVKELKR